MPTRRSTITIEVTDEDIRRAERNNSFECVVSQAIARTITDATAIDSDMQSIRFTVPVSRDGTCERWLYWTPYEVQQYIVGFDAGDEIRPFAFQLRKPERRPSTRAAGNTESGNLRYRAERAYEIARGKALRQGKSKEEANRLGREAYAKIVGKEAPPRPQPPLGATRNAGEGLITRRMPPRGNHRTYGGRLMRINKEAFRRGDSDGNV